MKKKKPKKKKEKCKLCGEEKVSENCDCLDYGLRVEADDF